uniref:Uncharacterized protein n=1 Tax=Oryza brachyantha TaxID=4533 RepID=J3MRF7_ORYBR
MLAITQYLFLTTLTSLIQYFFLTDLDKSASTMRTLVVCGEQCRLCRVSTGPARFQVGRPQSLQRGQATLPHGKWARGYRVRVGPPRPSCSGAVTVAVPRPYSRGALRYLRLPYGNRANGYRGSGRDVMRRGGSGFFDSGDKQTEQVVFSASSGNHAINKRVLSTSQPTASDLKTRVKTTK